MSSVPAAPAPPTAGPPPPPDRRPPAPPGRRPPAPPRPALDPTQLAATAAAGMAAAVLIPGHLPGLGLSLAWATIVIAVLATRPWSNWSGAWRRAAAAVAVSAGGLPVISDAGWVVVPGLLAGVGLAVLALAGGRSWAGLLRPALRCVPIGLRSVGAVTRGLRSALPTNRRRHPVARAALLTTIVLILFGALFAAADRLLGQLVVRYLVPDLDLGVLPARLLVATLVLLGAATLVLLRPRASDDRPLAPSTMRLRGVEWQAPLIALNLLFGAFVLLQIGVLFGGHDRVLRTAGLTYAEYARSGFGQLIVVAALTLAVIAAAARTCVLRGPGDARLQRLLLALLGLLTLVVLASALHRLGLYEQAFGSTRLRVTAQAVLWWFAAVFALLLLAGASRRNPALPRAVALLTAAAVIGIGYAQPDARIAERNVARYLEVGGLDTAYLAGLSADAVPVLLTLPDEVRGCVLDEPGGHGVGRTPPDTEGLAGWNRSRARSAALLAAADPRPACALPGR